MIQIGDLVKATEKIPAAGRYKCLICGMIVDVDQHFIDRGTPFFACPVCHAGTEEGPL